MLAKPPYVLRIDGEVDNPLTLTLEEILSLPFVERAVRLGCAGGPRDDTVMRGPTVEQLLTLAGARDDACLAAFHCADGLTETIPLVDLIQCQAFLVYLADGEPVGDADRPVRLAIPGKFGHLWAKWVCRIELLSGTPA